MLFIRQSVEAVARPVSTLELRGCTILHLARMAAVAVAVDRTMRSCLVEQVGCRQLEVEHHLACRRTLASTILAVGSTSVRETTATLATHGEKTHLEIPKTPLETGEVAMRLPRRVILGLILLRRWEIMLQVRKDLFLPYRRL